MYPITACNPSLGCPSAAALQSRVRVYATWFSGRVSPIMSMYVTEPKAHICWHLFAYNSVYNYFLFVVGFDCKFGNMYFEKQIIYLYPSDLN